MHDMQIHCQYQQIQATRIISLSESGHYVHIHACSGKIDINDDHYPPG